jgi:hypothetical protein
MAAPTFRDDTHLALAGGNTTAVVNKPTGTVDNDIVVVFLHRIAGGYNAAVTPAAGFTQLDCRVNTGQQLSTCSFWKRASGEGASWSFSWTGSTFREAIAASYSGALAAGDPFSFHTSAQQTATSNTYPNISGTTTAADEMLIWAAGNWEAPSNPAINPPTGFTLRESMNTGLGWADKTQAVAGGTGTLQGTYAGTAGQTNTLLMGLRPAVVASSLPGRMMKGMI